MAALFGYREVVVQLTLHAILLHVYCICLCVCMFVCLCVCLFVCLFVCSLYNFMLPSGLQMRDMLAQGDSWGFPKWLAFKKLSLRS